MNQRGGIEAAGLHFEFETEFCGSWKAISGWPPPLKNVSGMPSIVYSLE